MPHPSTGRPVSPDAPAELVAAMAQAGLSSADVRRRLHTLFPDQAPSFWTPWLRRGVFDEPVGRRRAPYQESQLRLGVEVVAAVAEGLAPDPHAALLLEPEDIDALEDLTGDYDPSGAILANCMMLIGALRGRIRAGERPVLSQSRYQELLMDVRLVADVPEAHRLRWHPAPSVVARRLGDGDWSRALAALGMDGGQPALLPAEAQPVAREVQELDDPGIGLIAAPADSEQRPEHVWDELRERIEEELAVLAWKDVLVLRYTALPDQGIAPPSAWARTGPDGTTVCLSGVNGPTALWPREDSYFRQAPWREPVDRGVAWNAGPLRFQAAAQLMVEGMRLGRLCTDPYRFCWGVGDAETGSVDIADDDDDELPGSLDDGPAPDPSSSAGGPGASVLSFPGPQS